MNSKKAMKNLTFRKSNILLNLTPTLIFFLFPSSLRNAKVRSTHTTTITQITNTNEDGFTDNAEKILKTNKNDKYGKKDMDNLYDFEKYLDNYESNNTNSQKYNYNDSKSYGDVIGITTISIPALLTHVIIVIKSLLKQIVALQIIFCGILTLRKSVPVEAKLGLEITVTIP